jgi:hypothetical protein
VEYLGTRHSGVEVLTSRRRCHLGSFGIPPRVAHAGLTLSSRVPSGAGVVAGVVAVLRRRCRAKATAARTPTPARVAADAQGVTGRLRFGSLSDPLGWSVNTTSPVSRCCVVSCAMQP